MSQQVHLRDPQVLPADWQGQPDLFERLMQQPGKRYRKVAGRETLRIELAGQRFFIKKHFGVGWSEVFKNWLMLKRPVVSAENEVAAIARLQQLHIPTTPYVAHGQVGCLPATMRSFVMTEDLGEIVTLEDLALRWQTQPASVRYKRAIIRRVAEIARQMHAQPMYHRDFYICHFCFKAAELELLPPRLHVLDLHRAAMPAQPAPDMQMKDLAALYFSAMDLPLSRGDVLMFLRHYLGADAAADVRAVMRGEVLFYRKIAQRALKLYAKFQRKIRAGVAM